MRRASARSISPVERLDLAAQKLEQRSLAAAVRSHQSDAHSGGDGEIEIFEQGRASLSKPAITKADAFEMDQAFGLAAGGGEVDSGARGLAAGLKIRQFGDQTSGVVDARFGFSGARFGPAAQPLHFGTHAILQRALALGLGVQELGFLFQEDAVIAGDIKEPVGINAIQLRHSGGDVFEEVAIVADDDAGERRGLEQFLQPLDSREIQMVGGFIEQDDFGILHQSLGDREALAPAAGKLRGLGVEIAKARAAQGLRLASLPFRFRDAGRAQSSPHHFANGFARCELRVLRDIDQARLRRGAPDRRNPAQCSPARICSNVDLPEPLGPIRPRRSPS